MIMLLIEFMRELDFQGLKRGCRLTLYLSVDLHSNNEANFHPTW